MVNEKTDPIFLKFVNKAYNRANWTQNYGRVHTNFTSKKNAKWG